MLEFRSSLVNALDVLVGDTKLVLVSTRCNLLMSTGLHVRIHADRNRSDLLQPAGNAIDSFELRFALGIKGVYALLESRGDLAFGFPDACKYTFIGGSPSFQN